ncbi:MAG: hypothetical protein PHN49_07050 [Candidatus Omnitrophica bacterium]|nr:hypothetical protein [Candidatus Omnitrophota bacterium]MDD5671377.1 hypothetical protein [Candidatus Omnitrophota bacterium]
MMKLWKWIGFGLCLFLTAPLLFAGTITNEGKTPVKISGKSENGMVGGSTVLPGQTVPMRQKFLWLKHIPEGAPAEIRIKIVNDDGTTGYINTVGGQYTCPQAQQSPVREERAGTLSKPTLQPGYATNHSNVQLYLTTISSRGAQRTSVLMPGQTVTIPADVEEVKAQPFSHRSDLTIQVEVLMPDGSRQSILSPRGSVYLKEYNR